MTKGVSKPRSVSYARTDEFVGKISDAINKANSKGRLKKPSEAKGVGYSTVDNERTRQRRQQSISNRATRTNLRHAGNAKQADAEKIKSGIGGYYRKK